MKLRIYIVSSVILIISLPMRSADGYIRHYSTLQRLVDNNLVYDSIAPPDSIISWGQQISPQLEKGNYRELFFRIKQLLVHLYSLRGDIGKAIDEAQQMYEKAEAMNYGLGIALSSCAIGDAYYCSNMPEKAIESYKETINHPALSSPDSYYKAMALVQLINILVRQGDMEQVEVYRDMLYDTKAIQTNKVVKFYAAVIDVLYYVQKNDLTNVRASLAKATQIYQSDPQPSYRTSLCYIQGQYNEARGAYESALQYYDRILNSISQKMKSINYLQIAYTKANLLVKMNRKKEAARLYEEISIITDSVSAPSYAHRINNLRVSYEESRMKVENKAEFNRILIEAVLVGIALLLIILYVILHIKKQNKKITNSKLLLEQSRLQAEKAIHTKSLFLSNMSHEIRTPLSALSGFSNLLTEQGLDKETRRQCSDIIQQNSDLLLKLINDVIDLSNLEIGNMKFNFGYYDAIALCRNVIDTVNKVKQTSAELRFNTSMESLQLYTDDSRLQQLLINLLINATKFTPQGNITLGVELYTPDFALFSVTDTGCGIPLKNQSKIFNRFEKLNEGAQGTGLGLSICQLIIERIGGKIWIDSQYIDGCRFCFTHPINPLTKEKEVQV